MVFFDIFVYFSKRIDLICIFAYIKTEKMKELKKKIENKGLKQTFIAKKLGVSNQLLNMWLNEKRDTPQHRIEQLKRLLA